MKDFKTYLEDLYATPANTMGMGNIAMPTDSTVGSGDIPLSLPVYIKKLKKRKKFKRYKI